MRGLRVPAVAAMIAAGVAATVFVTSGPAGGGIRGRIVTPGRAVALGPAQGALFVGDYRHSRHFCSGAVVHSSGHDLVATAAHCVSGNGTGLEFVPGYRKGRAPDGAWRVVAVFVDAAWQQSQDPHHDIAFLRVAANSGHRIESRVHALHLGVAPARRTRITMFGYLSGTDDAPLHCTRPTYRSNAHPAYPAINCKGFGGGTSGGAWRTARGALVGVTGGYHQGGCSPDTSYSAPFGAASTRLWRRAEQADRSDVVVPAGPDGC